MNREPPWERLKEVASKQQDATALKLAATIRDRDAAKAKLEMLLGYRRDYQARLQSATAVGIEREALFNYRTFLGKLEQAIEQQSNQLVEAQRHVHNAQLLWAQDRKRVESYRVLDDRSTTMRARQDTRRAQQIQDEYAARTVTRFRDADD